MTTPWMLVAREYNLTVSDFLKKEKWKVTQLYLLGIIRDGLSGAGLVAG